MAFPEVPSPNSWFGWLIYLIGFFVAIWVVFQIVPAIADFIRSIG